LGAHLHQPASAAGPADLCQPWHQQNFLLLLPFAAVANDATMFYLMVLLLVDEHKGCAAAESADSCYSGINFALKNTFFK
jgi:hypothetical protein